MNIEQTAKNIARWTMSATIGFGWMILYGVTIGKALWKLALWAWGLW